MTNAEKYKSVEAWTAAFDDYCENKQHNCIACKLLTFTRNCRFAWLELEEAPMTAKKVADILAEHSKWRRGEGKYVGSEVLGIVLDRAVELLRGSSNEQK